MQRRAKRDTTRWMTGSTIGPAEETFDPHDWDALRALGHQMVDDMFSYLETLRDRPAWQPVPDAIAAQIHHPLPTEPTTYQQVYEDFKTLVLPYPSGNIHPRFWGWVQGNGTPFAMLADLLASAMNPQMAGFSHAPVLVEHAVIDWCKQLLGVSAAGSGLLTSGGTMANLTALAVARHAALGDRFRAEGLQDPSCPRLVAYGSTETHGWAHKSMEFLGLGHRALHLIEVDDDYRISVPHLRARIAADRAAGDTPFCVIATAGTVNTGAIDDLGALADLTHSEDLWLHVDGAFGALAHLSPQHRHLVAGMERADSIAFDLHKWMSMPFEAGCVLVQRPGAQHAAFAYTAPYIAPTSRGVAGNAAPFSDLGIELTRSFKALKIWMSIKAHGSDKFGRLIAQNIEQARTLAALIKDSRYLQLMAPVALNIVCFRYRAPDLSPGQLDHLNQELLLRLQESGIAVPSGTWLRGSFVLRVANVNHRSVVADFLALLQAVEGFGEQLRLDAIASTR
jgi:aromatic-L-amino-acid/L-tryptophan decarboxylase